MEGWIKLHRKMLDWEWYSDSVVKDVFIHLLLLAGYSDRKYRGQKLERGSLIITIDELSRELGYSRSQIKTALKKLEESGEIAKESPMVIQRMK